MQIKLDAPHLYVPVPDLDAAATTGGECMICGLPEGNRRHNARPTRKNPRTKRMEYTDDTED
jgi:hypothetical protein